MFRTIEPKGCFIDPKIVHSVSFKLEEDHPLLYLQYLGEEMDEFSGRTFHEPGTHITLPLLMLPGLVLVPGQTLPLHLFQPQVIFNKMYGIIHYDTFGKLQLPTSFISV